MLDEAVRSEKKINAHNRKKNPLTITNNTIPLLIGLIEFWCPLDLAPLPRAFRFPMRFIC